LKGTFAVGTAFDMYEIDIYALSSSPDDMQITIDDNTESRYHQEDADGTSLSSRSNWLIGSADNDYVVGTVVIFGDKLLDSGGGESNSYPKISGRITGNGPNGIVSGEHRVSSDQISSIELVPSGSDLSYQADVYGRSFAE